MSQDHFGSIDETQPYLAPDGLPEPPRHSCLRSCLIVCAILGVISIVLCAGVGYFVYTKGVPLAIQGARQLLQTVLIETDLSDEEQAAILEQYDRVGDGYLEGDLSGDDVAQILQELAELPLSTIVVRSLGSTPLERSGLSEEEKAEAQETLQRVLTGVMKNRIDQSDLQTLLRHVRQYPEATEPGKQLELKPSLTDEELRAFFAEAKELCDKREIPLDETEFKTSEQIKEIIDQYLP